MNLYRLLIFASWFSMSCLINFVAIPAVFRNVSKLSEAGNVGMIVFGRFNGLELVCALLTALLFFYPILKNKVEVRFFKLKSALQIFLIVLTCSYVFHLTPKIKDINTNRALLSENGETQKLEALELEHDKYHKLYVKLDSVKLLSLLTLLAMGIRQEKIV